MNLIKSLCALIALSLCAPAFAVVKQIDGISYNLQGDEAMVVTCLTLNPNTQKYNTNKYRGDIVIPETVTSGGNTYTVTSIGHYRITKNDLSSLNTAMTGAQGAFLNCTGLTSVTLPKTIKKISQEAFKGCKKLTSINLPEGLEEINENAFYGCSSLDNVKLPNSLKFLKKGAFGDCTSLSEIILPWNLDETTVNETEIFMGCTGLKLAVVCSPVNLPARMFEGCRNLSKVVLSSKIQEINHSVFHQCHGLVEAKGGDGVYMEVGAKNHSHLKKHQERGFGIHLTVTDKLAAHTIRLHAPSDATAEEKAYWSEVAAQRTSPFITDVEFGTTTGVDDVATDDSSCDTEIYNLQGVKVDGENLAPGIYLKKAGNKVVKVLVR